VFQANLPRVLGQIGDDDRVLDVGGWYRPLCRADVVVDLLPYATRGKGGWLGPGPEWFDASTWVTQDVCSAALPFPDKHFDYVVCSQTLEDLRDPIFLCSELLRVARRGYIEVPSRAAESVRGLEGRNYAGHYHHRWLVEVLDGELVFRFKTHAIHEDRRYHLPRGYGRTMSDADRIEYLFWQGTFKYREAVQISHIQTRRELAAFVDGIAPLSLTDRVLTRLRAPLTAWQYRDWRALVHPLNTHVRRERFPDGRFWEAVPEISTSSVQR